MSATKEALTGAVKDVLPMGPPDGKPTMDANRPLTPKPTRNTKNSKQKRRSDVSQSTTGSDSNKKIFTHKRVQQQQQQQQQQRRRSLNLHQRFRDFLQFFRNLRAEQHERQQKKVSNKTSLSLNTKYPTKSLADATHGVVVDDDQSRTHGSDLTCKLCFEDFDHTDDFYAFKCQHKFCHTCLSSYLKYQITESRTNVTCPECTEKLHPNDVYSLLEANRDLLNKYEEFMLRRVLCSINDVRYCPAPNCTYAIIASGCASCPQLTCQYPGCNTSFCYHCKQYWHPNLTCDDASLQRSKITYNQNTNNNSSYKSSAITNKSVLISRLNRSNSHISLVSTSANLTVQQASMQYNTIKDELKFCPKCQAPIVKMDDGSCNHITCAVCGCEFCWLCMKEISDLHYLSPSGCTFWGKKPWSRKKKILLQLGTLIGAPVGIALVAGVAVPAILIGLPIWTGRKVYMKMKSSNKHKRNVCVVSTVCGSLLIAPLVATLSVAIGVPILLAYVYGVVPISLCRSGGCGVTTNTNGVRLAFDDEEAFTINSILQSQLNGQQIANPIGSQASSIQVNGDQTKVDVKLKMKDLKTFGGAGSVDPHQNQSPKTTKVLESASTCGTYLDNSKTKRTTSTKKNANNVKPKRTTSTKQDTHSVNINPSIGDASIGGDLASCDDDDFIDDDDDEDEDDDDNETMANTDRDSASNRALSGSAKKQHIKFNVKTSEVNGTTTANNNNTQMANKTTDVKSCDSFSVTMSVKSYNPSCIALAGSIKDNQSIESGDYAKADKMPRTTVDSQAIHLSSSSASITTSKSLSNKSNTSRKSNIKNK